MTSSHDLDYTTRKSRFALFRFYVLSRVTNEESLHLYTIYASSLNEKFRKSRLTQPRVYTYTQTNKCRYIQYLERRPSQVSFSSFLHGACSSIIIHIYVAYKLRIGRYMNTHRHYPSICCLLFHFFFLHFLMHTFFNAILDSRSPT